MRNNQSAALKARRSPLDWLVAEPVDTLTSPLATPASELMVTEPLAAPVLPPPPSPSPTSQPAASPAASPLRSPSPSPSLSPLRPLPPPPLTTFRPPPPLPALCTDAFPNCGSTAAEAAASAAAAALRGAYVGDYSKGDAADDDVTPTSPTGIKGSHSEAAARVAEAKAARKYERFVDAKYDEVWDREFG